ncbi:MAG: MiaB/RimO family radical SAM methylthiotransferase [Planctomycetes bacterium]|nr:MiaB/RimO family radical SAM methylthiotransferase [Planctomycetota bacterium]
MDAPVRDLSGHPGGHTAQVAVMRGCDMNCTFCIVPSVRGRVESRPVAEIVDECRRLADLGVVDITLLGQTIDAYGRDLGGRHERPQLARLLDEIAEIDAIKRLRLITLHPSYCDVELVAAMARSPQFLRLLPIPLQSGSDSVLKRMKRGYSVSLYAKRVELLRQYMPDIELVSDWIVGFPGETDEDFELSVARMEEFQFLQSYVFQYSPRPGTVAYDMVDDVSKEVKGGRNARLLDFQRSIARARTPKMVGLDSTLLLEQRSEKHDGFWTGRCHNGHHTLLADPDGQLVSGLHLPVHLSDWNGKQLVATPRYTGEELVGALNQVGPAHLSV